MIEACAPVSKENTHFDYGIGVGYSGDPVPGSYRIWEVRPTLWAVFPCMGPVWGRIFKKFLPGSVYHILDDTDFELYSGFSNPGCFCGIWIPSRKNGRIKRLRSCAQNTAAFVSHRFGFAG